ncbi:uncharacterized protein PGRI_089170 [Penicillium griseofulvum]|uniref:Endosomal/vacuolar adapter protein YPT35 n=1 Tax=Penicillium patulum TaxID=5078 RepID=A0A135LRB8_PENPA|nr:uncharacterized protein PGRI_089170 [Penicillium griseofulvum]KXG51524.1 hypothetical protein PGRI_089170 [Penicillium griseofulvum]
MEPAPEEAGSASKPHHPSSPHPDIQPTPALRPETDNTNDDPNSTPKTTTHSGHGTPQSSASSTTSRPVSAVVPPYWRRHERNASHASQSSLHGAARITLEDNTADPNSETSRGLWASSVAIDDHVVVRGMTGVGSYVVWNCRIQTLDGGPIVIRMRYSEFDDLRQRLVDSFPHARSALPALPPKSVIYKFRPKFLESRRVGLEYFLNCVLLNPEFSGSPIVKDFLFGRMC